MSFLNRIFGTSSGCVEKMQMGAQIIDVRTVNEFQQGSARGSINIPLDTLAGHVTTLKNEGRPVILCCASGARSGRAASMLKAHGIDACNAGSWISLKNLKAE